MRLPPKCFCCCRFVAHKCNFSETWLDTDLDKEREQELESFDRYELESSERQNVRTRKADNEFPFTYSYFYGQIEKKINKYCMT